MDRNCLGKLIEECKRNGVNTVKQDSVPCYVNGNGDAVQVGVFVFGSNSHDTGISVNVNIIHPKTNKPFEIIRGTYWYSESTYGFNKFKRLKGKWDEPLKDAVSSLRASLLIKLHTDAIEEDGWIDDKRGEQKQELADVESIF